MDVFGYNRTGASGVFAYQEDSTLSISGVTTGTDLIQGWQIQYQQNITPVYECGSSKIYWAKGLPTGQANISRVVGNGILSISSSVCDTGKELKITGAGGACGGNKVTITCQGAICTSVGFTEQAGNPMVTQSVGITFAALSV